MMRSRAMFLLSLFLLAGALSAQTLTGEYQIGPRDNLEIRVLELPELNVDRRVNDSGAIDLPLAGQILVAGLTATEVKDRIAAVVTARFVNRANVSVVVKEFANKPVSVLGGVVHPGSLNISGRWNLQQAILAAGGLSGSAGRKLYVLRQADNGLSDRLEVDTEELFQRSSLIWNIPIFPSDIVTISVRVPVKVFCIGEFKSPGAVAFESEDKITLLTLVSKAGGLTERAARGKIRIKRRGTDGKDQELIVNFNRVLSGKDSDPVLLPDDVVIVNESFF